MDDSLSIAVDLGAGSGGVFLGGMSPSELLLEEVHRFEYEPISDKGYLRWDGSRIWREVRSGLGKAAERAHQLKRPLYSVEYTNATTTQMVNAQTGSWDLDLLSSLNLPHHLLAEIVPAGTNIGALRTSVANETGVGSVRVIATATHDTASAVVGTPLEAGFAYISSGTWSLVGVERDRPLINSFVSRRNFTNEGGAFGTIRFLKNVMGLWILESCRKEWRENGIDTGYDNLLGQMSSLPRTASLPVLPKRQLRATFSSRR